MIPTTATDIGFSVDHAFDNTPAWNAMIAPGGPSYVIFDGAFSFKTQPKPVERPIRIEGIIVNQAALMRDYAPSNWLEPFLEFRATSALERMAIQVRQGTNGVGIQFTGTSASDSIARDLYVTTGATGAMWGIPLCLISSEALGIRGCYLEDIELFAASMHIAWIVNAKGLTLSDVNCYPAGGSVNHICIQHSGQYRTQDVDWKARYLDLAYVYSTDDCVFTTLRPVRISASQDCTNVVNR